MGDHRAAPAKDGVAGQHGIVDEEAQRVGGVAGRAEHPDLQTGRGDHVAVDEALDTEAQGRVEGADPGALTSSAEPAGAFGVVGMAMGEQDLGDRAVRSATRSRCASSSGPGSITTQLDRVGGAQQPGVGALQGHDRRVVRESTFSAISALGRRRIFRPKATLSRTVRCLKAA